MPLSDDQRAAARARLTEMEELRRILEHARLNVRHVVAEQRAGEWWNAETLSWRSCPPGGCPPFEGRPTDEQWRAYFRDY